MAVTGGSIGTGRAGAIASAVAAPRLSSAINPAGCQNGCEDEHEGTHRPPPSFSSFVHVFRAIQIEDEDEHENEEE